MFFVVLLSLLIQGWTLSSLARLLKLEIPPTTQVVQRVELDIPGQQELELVGYRLAANSPAVIEKRASLTLPRGARVVAILRNRHLLERLEPLDPRPGDYLYLMTDPIELPNLDRLFVASPTPARLSDLAFFGEFVLNGDARVGDLCTVYGICLADSERQFTLDELIRRGLNAHPVVGDRLQLGSVELVVRQVLNDRIAQVGLKLPRAN